MCYQEMKGSIFMGILDIWKRKNKEQQKNESIMKKVEVLEENKKTVTNKELPKGIGYKSGWLVIEGSNQKAIADKLLCSDYENMTFDTGLEYIHDKTIIAPDFQGRNFVMGANVDELLYDLENMMEKYKDFPKVYAYITHRVSDVHGFGLMEYGKFIRIYRQDQEEIVAMGEPLLEEEELGIRLPWDIDEMWDHWEDDAVTKMDEEVIMELALHQIGVDGRQYPYGDVLVGIIK